MSKKNPIIKTARVISAVFSPIIIPTYCTILAMWLTPLNAVSENARFVASAVVLILTCVIPMMILLWMVRFGHIKDLDISDKRQRLKPLLYILVCYVLTATYMYNVNSPLWLLMFYVSGCILSLLVALVSLKWKISGHGTGMGALIGMITAFIEGGYSDYNMLPWLCGAIIISGLVGSARLILRRHSLAQVYVGIATGAFVTTVLMLLPKWIIF